ncbi:MULTISPECIES: DUF881 domain-containing protein [unclassified Janibacter]|uniref:DUF881 domain-containing protein n=1 Tax=unclassified Janibacter TaxID=2649294 RepID=UPI003D06A53D
MASTGRFRWLTARPTGWSLLVPVVAALAGLLFSTSGQTARGTDLRSEGTDLPGLIRAETLDNEKRNGELALIQQDVDTLSAATTGNATTNKLTEQAEALAADAGTRAVTGPTVTVSLDDAPLTAAEVPDGFTVDDIVVHQQDVQAVVNALWKGGAEAMMLMDQRVISTSAVRCVGNTLILQGRVYSPPFTIKAVGDPAQLKAALEKDRAVGIYRQYVNLVGLGYEVSEDPEETLPAYEGSTRLQHAAPAY